MKIGLLKEIKNNEYRVSLTPGGVKSYIQAGHTVFVESGAGKGSGFSDSDYVKTGAQILGKAGEVWAQSEMVLKVKEPLESEYQYFRPGLILYTYLHLAANRALTEALLSSHVSAVAFETITAYDNSLPCLAPMSEIAGRLSVQEGAKCLEKQFGGRGILLGGIPGVEKGRVVIIGGGAVGMNACKIAVGMGADVTVLDVSAKRLAYFDDIYGGRIQTLFSNDENISASLAQADLVIGAVLLPGRTTPKLVLRRHLSFMKPGAVIVDVAVDQGGCVETSHPTTHDDPTFVVDGVVHYCVANMPGAVARTATFALENATVPYGLTLAGKGLESAMKDHDGLRKGLNCYKGHCTIDGVSEAFGIPYQDAAQLMK